MLRRAALAGPRRPLTTRIRQRIPFTRIPANTRRHISLWPKRSRPDPPPQPVRVYFAKPTSNFRSWFAYTRSRALRIIGTTVVFWVCFDVYKGLVLVPLLNVLNDGYEALPEKDKIAIEEEEEDYVFLPCPFTEFQEEQPPYKSSDPEWPFLMKAKDPATQQKLSEDICRLVVRYCRSHPHFAHFFGGDKDLKIRRVWLDFAIPARPPAKHFIKGLIFDDEGVFWGERSIDAATVNTLKKVMYPTGMAMAVRDFFYAIYVIMRDDFRRNFGSGEQQTPPTVLPNPVAMRLPGQQGSGNVIVARVPRSGAGGVGTPGTATLAFPAGEDTLINRTRLAFTYAAARYIRHQQSRQPVRRGCFELEGVASIENKTRAATVAIHAWYDPQTHKFVDAWIVPKRWGSKPAAPPK